MNRRTLLTMALLASLCPVPAIAQDGAEHGALRITGSPSDAQLIDRLWRGYAAGRPDARMAKSLHGAESTLAGVYTGTADIALMARETREPMERMAFQWAMLTPPFEVEIATAGIMADRPNAQLGVFVNATNPLAGVTMTQLDAVLGDERLRGGRAIATWGDLGLDGSWAAARLQPYGPEVESINALYVRRLLMKDSRKWRADFRATKDDAAVVGAVAGDRHGIGIAPLRLATPKVRAIAVEGVAPDTTGIASRAYPLARAVRMVVYRPEDGAIDRRVTDFLRHVLSPDGQAAIAEDGVYLPLPRERAAAEAAKLQ